METPAIKSTPASPLPQRELAPRAERTKEAEPPKPKDEVRPPPVVNTQGQTTGRIVNTTA